MAPPILLPFLQLLVLLSSPSAQAQQNITLGSSLTTQEHKNAWLSPSLDFAFGFRPIEGNTSFYLLAIWFNKISDKTVAWYAKTGEQEPAPVQVPSGSSLRLTLDGALSLRDPTGREVWNPQVIGADYAGMLDTGNFVLAAANGSSTKWEAFSNPADTILLTQVLSLGMALRSRLMSTDYSNGRFLLNMQADGVVLCPVAVPSGNHYDTYWSAEFSYNNSLKMALFEALYGRKCRTPLYWKETEGGQVIGPDILKEAEEQVRVIRQNLKTAQSRQKSYTDNRRGI